MRQPVIEKYFEKLLTTIASSPCASAVSARRAVREPVVDLVGDEPHAALAAHAAPARQAARGAIIVPVGLAGLAISSPLMPSRRTARATSSAVGIQSVCRPGLEQHRPSARAR